MDTMSETEIAQKLDVISLFTNITVSPLSMSEQQHKMLDDEGSFRPSMMIRHTEYSDHSGITELKRYRLQSADQGKAADDARRHVTYISQACSYTGRTETWLKKI